VLGWNAEVSPVCAIVGGILAQELIKVVTGKDEPINNFFFYNGMDGGGFVELIPSK
jgi:ubiquitin-like 1-activating enzyme E1 A